MSILYKKVILLVSRRCYHSGEGLKRRELVFFRSIEEYDRLSKEKNWEKDRSFHAIWCVRPIEIEGRVTPKDYANFLRGGKLPVNKVLFSSEKVSLIHDIGDW